MPTPEPPTPEEFERSLIKALEGHDDSERVTVNVQLCRASRDGLDRASQALGVSVTALLDVLGHRWSAIAEHPLLILEQVSPSTAATVTAARAVDVQRRRRAPRTRDGRGSRRRQ